MVNIFYLKELFVFGGWLTLSGIISLLGLISLHPLIIVIFTFGVGMILMYITTLILLASDKE